MRAAPFGEVAEKFGGAKNLLNPYAKKVRKKLYFTAKKVRNLGLIEAV